MRESKYIILLIISFCTFVVGGCDKKDSNGDLDGMWQLVLWTSSDGDTLATKDSMIFYSFQLQMMKFQRLIGKSQGSIMSMFKNYPNYIVIYNPQNYKSNGHDMIYNDTIISGSDTIIRVSVLKKYGVPSDGVMSIESLSSDNLILSSPQQGKLVFRKY